MKNSIWFVYLFLSVSHIDFQTASLEVLRKKNERTIEVTRIALVEKINSQHETNVSQKKSSHIQLSKFIFTITTCRMSRAIIFVHVNAWCLLSTVGINIVLNNMHACRQPLTLTISRIESDWICLLMINRRFALRYSYVIFLFFCLNDCRVCKMDTATKVLYTKWFHVCRVSYQFNDSSNAALRKETTMRNMRVNRTAKTMQFSWWIFIITAYATQHANCTTSFFSSFR